MLSPTDRQRLAAGHEHHITPRRMLILRSRLHLARASESAAKTACTALESRVRDAKRLLAASEACGFADIVEIDRREVGRLTRMLDLWRNELDDAIESVRRVDLAIQNAMFAQGLAASQEGR